MRTLISVLLIVVGLLTRSALKDLVLKVLLIKKVRLLCVSDWGAFTLLKARTECAISQALLHALVANAPLLGHISDGESQLLVSLLVDNRVHFLLLSDLVLKLGGLNLILHHWRLHLTLILRWVAKNLSHLGCPIRQGERRGYQLIVLLSRKYLRLKQLIKLNRHLHDLLSHGRTRVGLRLLAL